MNLRRVQRAIVIVLATGLVASCARSGPAPEVPIITGGNGGTGGTNAAAGNGGTGGNDTPMGGAGGVGNGGTGGASGAGGVSGISGGGGAGGFGGTGGTGGQAGTGGLPATCTDTDTTFDPNAFGDPYTSAATIEKGTATGTNGAFEDVCDEDGNLIEHSCETQLGCGSGGNANGDSSGACAPQPHLTGYVWPTTVDCLGLCVDGSCEVPCPADGTTLTITSVDLFSPSYLLEASSLGVRYQCTRDNTCTAPLPTDGEQLTVVSSPPRDNFQPDCRTAFTSVSAPLVLSDGCNYFDCFAEGPIEAP
jgi:hypothetical protein